MAEGAVREILYVLKVRPDASAAETIRQFGQAHKAAQDQANKASNEGVKLRSKMEQDNNRDAIARNRQATREVEQEQSKQSSAIERGIRQRMQAEEKATKARQQAEERAAREILATQEKAAKQSAAAAEKAAMAAAAATVKAEKEKQQAIHQSEMAAQGAQRKAEQANTAVLMSSRHLLHGFIQLTTAVAEFGILGEESSEKLVRKLVALHAAYNALKGAIFIWRGLEHTMRSYTAAVEAAAAAHKALAAAEALSAAAGAASGGGGVGGAVGGAAQAGMGLGTRVLGRGLMAGRGALAMLGGGSAMAGAGMVAIPALAAAAFYKGATMGPEAAARSAAEHTERMEGSIATRRQYEEGAEHDQDRIGQIERERRDARAGLAEHAFEKDIGRQKRGEDIRSDKISKTMQGWSASMEGGGRREPGIAGYQSVETAMAEDRTAGQGVVAKYQAEADKAAKEVADRKAEQAAAEKRAEQLRMASVSASSSAAGTAQRASEDKWVTGTNWIRSTGKWLGGSTETEELNAKAGFAGQLGKGAAKQAGEAQSKASEAAKATEDSLKRQQEATEKLAEEKNRQAQRDLKNAEEYISKLKEMHEAHLKNADAIERAGRALTVQLALEKPHQRNKLFRAMEHAKAGKATDKDLALLARNSSAEKGEEFEKEIEKRHPEFGGLREFLGKGKSQADAERAKAADEEKRIKAGEEHVNKTRDAAMKAADVMTDKLSSILQELFKAQETRFVNALEQIRSDLALKNASGKAGGG